MSGNLNCAGHHCRQVRQRGLIVAVVFLAAMLAPVVPAVGEVIEMKKGGRIEGEIVEVTAESVKVKVGDAVVSIAVKDIAPMSLYELRFRRIDPKDAAAHMTLAVFCVENNLFAEARRALAKVGELDPSRAQAVQAQNDEILKKEPAYLLETSQALLKQEKYDEAMRLLQTLLRLYPEGEPAAAARKALADAAAEVRKKNEEREKGLAETEKKKVDDKANEVERAVTDRFDRALKRIDEGKEQNSQGLENEGENKVTLADRAYQRAAERFLEAKILLQETIANSKDVDTLAAGKQKLEEVNRWIVIAYTNLGNLFALEQNFREALRWINKALIIDPTDRVAVELKLRISEQIIRRGWK